MMKSLNRFFLVIFCLAPLGFLACRQSSSSKAISPDSLRRWQAITTNRLVMAYETMEHLYKLNRHLHFKFLEDFENQKDTTGLGALKELRDQAEYVNKIIAYAKHFVHYNIGGGYDSTKYTLAKPYESYYVDLYFIRDGKTGEGLNIIQKLDGYVDFLNKKYPKVQANGFPKITHAQINNPLFKDFPDLQKKDFLEQRFKGADAFLTLITLTQFQLHVLIYENQVINYLTKQELIPFVREAPTEKPS